MEQLYDIWVKERGVYSPDPKNDREAVPASKLAEVINELAEQCGIDDTSYTYHGEYRKATINDATYIVVLPHEPKREVIF